MLDNTLQVIEDTVFKLCGDFDLLVDAAKVQILRPSGFEFVGQLQDAILAAVSDNIQAISADVPFVDFGSIEVYASRRPRAARYRASIRAQEETKSIDKSLLSDLCTETGVEVSDADGTIVVTEGHEMGFLEVLDRRRYEITLVKESPERYRAASRRRLSG